MTSIDIDPKYRLGLDQVDREHAQLIRIADDLKDLIKDQKASGESIQRITGELIRYTETHFDSEERLMAEKNYPGLPAHRELHRKLLAQVQEFAAEASKDRPSLALKMNLFMNVWLFEHITKDDAAFVRHVGITRI